MFFFGKGSKKSSRKRKKTKKRKGKRGYKKDDGKPPQKVDFKNWKVFLQGKRKDDKGLAKAYAAVPVCVGKVRVGNFLEGTFSFMLDSNTKRKFLILKRKIFKIDSVCEIFKSKIENFRSLVEPENLSCFVFGLVAKRARKFSIFDLKISHDRIGINIFEISFQNQKTIVLFSVFVCFRACVAFKKKRTQQDSKTILLIVIQTHIFKNVVVLVVFGVIFVHLKI